MRDQTTVSENPVYQQCSSVNGESGITVGQKEPPDREGLDSSTKPGGSPFFQAPRVTNLMARYNYSHHERHRYGSSFTADNI